MDALPVIGVFAGLGLGLYFIMMRLTPHRGVLRVCERLFIGIAALYLINLALSPFGVQIAQNPLTALATGRFGLAGAAVSAFLQWVP